jgi:hypothetical protein
MYSAAPRAIHHHLCAIVCEPHEERNQLQTDWRFVSSNSYSKCAIRCMCTDALQKSTAKKLCRRFIESIGIYVPDYTMSVRHLEESAQSRNASHTTGALVKTELEDVS